ncbi:hypothetical protein DGG96_05275 [Legionella qingyii]|uniref:Substrate of the Dot/Icm secretion system n=1 Tax=Legionella qingyii TaxID=2184757 RepID=A0A317U6M5_9GAMM|nr:hypothetical protein [Legionella qingyii]PWY56818.1 hypothetical protein DGG96_05275 [Legionella qingyii]RUR23624.1 hypothetical protein ELY20_06340 [Legionella qingyii]RUR26207.1 hypothetical protein ELY16_07200 [Legionella qingyii]
MSANSSVISSVDDRAFVREDLLKAMQLAGNSAELAQYLTKQVHEIVDNSRVFKKPEKMQVGQQILKAVDEFAQLVAYKFSEEAKQIWAGITPSTKFENIHRGITQEAVESLSKKGYEGIRFDFAIKQTGEEKGHFVRGYASSEKGAPPLDGETVDSLDRLFNAWLANEHQVLTEDGFFFKTDAEGNKTRQLTLDEVEEIMADSAQGFKDYLQSNHVETQLVSRQREYPGEHRLEETKKAAAQKAVERVIEAEEAEKVEAEVQPTHIGPT